MKEFKKLLEDINDTYNKGKYTFHVKVTGPDGEVVSDPDGSHAMEISTPVTGLDPYTQFQEIMEILKATPEYQ